MTEREEPPYPAATGGAGPSAAADDDWREQTTPGLTPVPGPGMSPYGPPSYRRPAPDATGYQPTPAPPPYEHTGYEQPGYAESGYGRPTYRQPGYGGQPSTGPVHGQLGYGEPGYGQPGGPVPPTAPDYSSRPLPVRRPDGLAAAALLLAGLAAGVSLLLRWLAGSEQTGWTLLREGLRGLGDIYRTGMWQPLAIVLGGGLLFVLGLLALAPARAHRTIGLLALLVTAAVGAGLLVPISAAHWRLGTFDVGFFCGIAVAVLGLLGSLKALLTGPRTAQRSRPAY